MQPVGPGIAPLQLLDGLNDPEPVHGPVAVAAFDRAMADVDVLAAPTLPVLPPRIGEETVELPTGEEILFRLTVIPYNSWKRSACRTN